LTRADWAIRLYDVEDRTKLIDYVSSFKNFGDRQLDEVIVFTGMYGIDNYMLWYMHDNIANYDFGTTKMELKLCIGNPNLSYYHNHYRVVDIKYDTRLNKQVLYALSDDSLKLRTNLKNYINLNSLNYNQDRKAHEVLIDVLEKNNIFNVQFRPHWNKELKNTEYRYLTINPEWTVYDFIDYICEDSGFEWFVKGGVLWVSPELTARKLMSCASQITPGKDHSSYSIFFKKIAGEARPMDVRAHWDRVYRCIWAKHSTGVSGGITKGCFIPIGSGKLSKRLFFDSLEGKLERSNCLKIFNRSKPTYNLRMGLVLSDLGNEEYVDKISVQKNIDLRDLKYPSGVKMDNGDGGANTVVMHQKENVNRLYQFLDQNAGLLLPATEGNPPPNSIIGNVEGREEASIELGKVYGNGREGLMLPTKVQRQDLRLQLANGWCLYIDGITSETFFQSSGSVAQTKPTVANATIYIDPVGNVTIGGIAALPVALSTHTHNLIGVLAGPATIPTTPPIGGLSTNLRAE